MNIIKGDTLEEQMKFVDIMLERLNRKKEKIAKGLITPFPISNFVDFPVEGVVLKYMFPVNGQLLFGGMFIEKLPKDGVDILFNLQTSNNLGTYRTESMFTKSNTFTIRPNIDIRSGNKLTVSVIPKIEGSEVSGVWTSLLWIPAMKELAIKKILIDELEKIGLEE